jgi:hypothetical protein
MVVKKNEIFLQNESGQAIFEFVVFLPLLLILMTVMLTTGNAINASINQQKATRGYFFNIIQNNSRIPIKADLDNLAGNGVNRVSAFSIGWRTKEVDGGSSLAACTKYNTLFGSINADETCDEPVLEDNKSQFIRIFTFFGVCTETYAKIDDTGNYRADWRRKQSDICTLGQ